MDSAVLASNREIQMSNWREVLESKANQVTHNEAFVLLTAIAKANPEHAAAVRDVMELMTTERRLARELEKIALNPTRETNEHNARIYSQQLEAVDPQPDGDY
ncbi:UNVERIFIED_ORG: hypothetical protein LHJ69_12720 [Shinella sp. XGS7]|nr:hypothetical protein [Shinella sp. XGS7]